MIINLNKRYGCLLVLLLSCKMTRHHNSNLYPLILHQILSHHQYIKSIPSKPCSESYFEDAPNRLKLHNEPRKKAFEAFLNQFVGSKEQRFYWMESGYGGANLCDIYGTFWSSDKTLFYKYSAIPPYVFDEKELILTQKGDSFGEDWLFMKHKVTEWNKDSILQRSCDTSWIIAHQNFVFAVHGKISDQNVRDMDVILFEDFAAPLDLNGL